jgi:hypothetical protein
MVDENRNLVAGAWAPDRHSPCIGVLVLLGSLILAMDPRALSLTHRDTLLSTDGHRTVVATTLPSVLRPRKNRWTEMQSR